MEDDRSLGIHDPEGGLELREIYRDRGKTVKKLFYYIIDNSVFFSYFYLNHYVNNNNNNNNNNSSNNCNNYNIEDHIVKKKGK